MHALQARVALAVVVVFVVEGQTDVVARRVVVVVVVRRLVSLCEVHPFASAALVLAQSPVLEMHAAAHGDEAAVANGRRAATEPLGMGRTHLGVARGRRALRPRQRREAKEFGCD